MADGEIKVDVNAEGVEEASGELAEGVPDPEGGGGGGGGTGLSQTLRGGIIGGLLVSALGPLLDIVDPILKILQAFVAPLAVVLLRLIQPVLVLLLKALPYLFDIAGYVLDLIDRIGPIAASIFAAAQDIISRLIGYLENPPTASDIATAIVSALSGNRIFGGSGGDDSGLIDPTTGELDDPTAAIDDPTDARPGEGRAADTIVQISGGARKILDVITKNGSIDRAP